MRIKIFFTLLLFLAMAGIAEEWMTFTTDDGLAQNLCGCVAIDHDGVVWVGHGDVVSGMGGVSSWDGETWSTYYSWTTEFGLRSNHINDIEVDQNNVKWFGTGTILSPGGITKFDNTEWTSFSFDTLPYSEGDWVTDVSISSTNCLWACASNVLLRYNDIYWRKYSTVDGLISRYPISIDIDNTDNLWCTSDVGICIFNGLGFVNYCESDGLIYDYTKSVLCFGNKVYTISKEELPWRPIQYGLSIFNHFYFETYDFDTINYSDMIFDNSGLFYLSNQYGVYYGEIPNFDDFRHLTQADGLSDNQVFDIAVDECNNKYFATRNGLTIFNEDEIVWSIKDKKPSIRNFNLEIFPNPFNSSCNILAEEAFDLVIYDIHGNIVESKSNISSSTWHPKDLPTGLYLLSIKNEHSSITRRITYLK